MHGLEVMLKTLARMLGFPLVAFGLLFLLAGYTDSLTKVYGLAMLFVGGWLLGGGLLGRGEKSSKKHPDGGSTRW